MRRTETWRRIKRRNFLCGSMAARLGDGRETAVGAQMRFVTEFGGEAHPFITIISVILQNVKNLKVASADV